MELSVQDWLIGIGAILIIGVLLDGYRRYRNERRNPVRMSRSLFGMGGGFERGDEELPNAELPSGGARPQGRPAADSPTPQGYSPVTETSAVVKQSDNPFEHDPGDRRVEPSFGDDASDQPGKGHLEVRPTANQQPSASMADSIEEAADLAEPAHTGQVQAEGDQAPFDDDGISSVRVKARATLPSEVSAQPSIATTAPAVESDATVVPEPVPEPVATDPVGLDDEPLDDAPSPEALEPSAAVSSGTVADIESFSADDDGIIGRVRVKQRERASRDLLGETEPLFADDDLRAIRSPAEPTSQRSKSKARKGTEPKALPEPEVVIVHVVSRHGMLAGQVLEQIFKAVDLRFGEMGIYHRHELEEGQGPVQFSVVNAVEPGTFDPSTLAEMSTPGLSFFMQLPGPEKPLEAFDAMVETARVVVKHLDADLLDETRSVFTAQTAEHYRERIRAFTHKSLIAG